jgi:hypothetical protein
MEEIITDLKGNRFRTQFDFLSPQQVSAVKSVLMKSEITPALVASLVSAIKQSDNNPHINTNRRNSRDCRIYSYIQEKWSRFIRRNIHRRS